MGKDKGANRSKNQSSSSAQAAALIQNTGFVGFSGRVPGGSLHVINPQLQVSLKKASKKDSITRTKALQEIAVQFGVMDDTETDAVIDVWTTIFKDLELENNYKVRELGLRAHIALIRKVGRNLAPHLKTLSGPWLMLMHDPHRVCSELANEALCIAIPQARHVNTWNYCKVQAIDFLSIRLSQSLQSLCEPLGYKGVEAQEIYDRTISTAMLGLAYLINILHSDQNNEVLSQYESLLGISFWVKNIANITPMVRRAVFTLLLAQIQRLPFMINQNIQKFYDFMIKTLQVKDPSDIYITTITEFFKSFPLEDSNIITAANANVFKESLCAFIRAGCVRDPLVILNLFKALPEKITSPQEKFLPKLWQATWKSMEIKDANPSPILNIHGHILQYICAQSSSFESVRQLLIDEIMADLKEYTERQKLPYDASEFCNMFVSCYGYFLENGIPENEINSRLCCFIEEAVFAPVNAQPQSITPEVVQPEISVPTSDDNHSVPDTSIDDNNNNNNNNDDDNKNKGKGKVNNKKKKEQSKPQEKKIIEHPKCSKQEQLKRIGTLFASFSSSNLVPHSSVEFLKAIFQNVFDKGDVTFLSFFTDISQKPSNFEFFQSPNLIQHNFEIVVKWISEMTRKDKTTPIYEIVSLICGFVSFLNFSDKTMETIYQLLSNISVAFAATLLSSILKLHAVPSHQLLDELAIKLKKQISAFTSKTANSLKYKFELLSILLFGTNANPKSLIKNETFTDVMETLTTTASTYLHSAALEELFNLLEFQAILYILKLIIIDAKNFLSSDVDCDHRPIGDLEYREILLLFDASVCTKYFWKSMIWNSNDWSLYIQQSQLSLSTLIKDYDNIETIIAQSPLAQAGQFGWNKVRDLITSASNNSLNLNLETLFTTLITSVHTNLQTIDLTWFSPQLYYNQTMILISLFNDLKNNKEVSPLNILDLIIQNHTFWESMVTSLDLLSSLNLYKFPIPLSFYLNNANSISKDNNNNSNNIGIINSKSPPTSASSYPRYLRFILELIKHLNFDKIITNREWIIDHLLLGFAISSDIIIPPIDRSIEEKEEWALCKEAMLSFFEDTFFPSFSTMFTEDNKHQFCQPDSLLDNVFKHMMTTLNILPSSSPSISSGNQLLLQTLSFTVLIRRMINGSPNRALSFYHQYLCSSLSGDVNSKQQYLLQLVENGGHDEHLLAISEVLSYISPQYLVTGESDLHISLEILQDISFAKLLSFDSFSSSYIQELTTSITWLCVILDTQLENQIVPRYIVQTLNLFAKWINSKEFEHLEKQNSIAFYRLTTEMSRLLTIMMTRIGPNSLSADFPLQFIPQFIALQFKNNDDNDDVHQQTLSLRAARYYTTKLVRSVLPHGEGCIPATLFQLLFSQLQSLPNYAISSPPIRIPKKMKSPNVYITLQLEEEKRRSETKQISLTEITPMESDYMTSLSRTLSLSYRALPNHIALISDLQISQSLYLLSYPHLEVQKSALSLLFFLVENIKPSSVGGGDDDEVEDQIEFDQLHPLLKALIILMPTKPLKFSFDFGDPLVVDTPYYFQTELQRQLHYLFIWMILIHYIIVQKREEKKKTTQMLNKKSKFSNLFRFLFSYLLSFSPSHYPQSQVDILSIEVTDKSSFDRLFSEFFFEIITALPTLVRHWWTDDCDRSMTAAVGNYTNKFISPQLIKNELSKVVAHNFAQYDNFNAKACEGTGTVTATYEEDDTNLTISIHLPSAYPLKPVEVEGNKQGVQLAQWRKWLLSMHTLLFTEDADILGAILLWKNSMDKLFEGIESCLICYSVFSQQHQIPKLSCKTCHNKFHSGCLYKWFNSSHKSNCPLCQTPWQAE